MNRNYRIVWNESTQSWVAASELSKSHSRTSRSSLGKGVLSVVLGSVLLAGISPVAMAYTANVAAGQTVTGETIDSIKQDVYGTANNSTITTGGRQDIYSGGEANDTTIESGGYQYVSADGIANNTILYGEGLSGNQFVYEGGVANGTTMNGGSQVVWGTANNTIINATINGGVQEVYLGGVSKDTTVEDGGLVRIHSGAQLQGTTQLNASGDIDAVDGVIDNQGTLVFNQNFDKTLDAQITGTGSVVKDGSNILTLNASNTYTGPTEVRGGTLLVGSTAESSSAQIAGNVDVQNGATLAGHGRILGTATINNGGTLSPG
ncbi:ESPR-type extended signal peptide-containing protein, partial [Saezia sanguinis]|uniref:ESPR-type extended signal peptide-containing protein n=1 Tax=Saezia sanguinis TaxID=1965230 RepID=UPI001951CAB9